MYKLDFWKATTERAVKTLAQTAVTLIGAELVGFADLDWIFIASASGVAAVVSVLTSLAGAAATNGEPSLGGGEHLS